MNILRYNGTGFVPEPAFANIANLNLNVWYRLTVDVTAGTGSEVNLSIQLISIADSSVAVSLATSTNFYLPAAGHCGVHCDRGNSRFSYFKVHSL